MKEILDNFSKPKPKSPKIFIVYAFVVKLIIVELIISNFFRIYIAVDGWLRLGRMPVFRDGLELGKTSIIDYGKDEAILLIGHFLNPIFVLLMLVLIYCDRKDNDGNESSTLLISIALGLILLGTFIRCTDAYSFVMFD